MGGTAGEGQVSAAPNCDDYLRIFVSHVQNKLAVIGGVIAGTIDEAIKLGLAAKEAGIAAIQITL